MNKQDLLFEIGCEELPVTYIRPALAQMKAHLGKALIEHRLGFESITAEATPRRLVLMVRGLDVQQPDRIKEVLGPKQTIAFQADGQLSPAGQGFCKKAGLALSQLQIKNERLYAEVEEKGQPTLELLPPLLNGVIKQITFPKSMRWEASGDRFARPVRWLLALLGEEVVPVAFADVFAGRITQGHPLLAAPLDAIANRAHYLETMDHSYVLLSSEKRKEHIRELLHQEAAQWQGALVEDEELLEMVCLMTEWPGAVVGHIDASFMAMPKEIITTAMREHQRYFAMEKADNSLLPNFIMIHDNPFGQAGRMQPGCENVLRARLKDAEFFYKEDLKVPLEDRVAQLDRVLWIKGLGHLLDKTNRLERLSAYLAEQLEPSSQADAVAAAHLCKADLITNMIQEKEYNGLQGYMGGHYALKQGARPEVALAIEEHYLPRGAVDQLPQSPAGRLLALAERLDNLVGCWGAGFAPTGTKDPYALRRAAQGLIAISLQAGYHYSLRQALSTAIAAFSQFEPQHLEILEGLKAFIQGRLETELANRQLPPDLIQAVLGVWWDDMTAVVQKAEAFQAIRQNDSFNETVVSFSRVVNILPKSVGRVVSPEQEPLPVSPDLFQAPIEKDLYEHYQTVGQAVAEMAAQADYRSGFAALAALKPAIDGYFDQVMVMDQDRAIRTNRLNFLTNLAVVIWSLADFSKLVIKG